MRQRGEVGEAPQGSRPACSQNDTTTLAAVNIPAETFWIFAIALLAFGTAFVTLGLSSERGYWSQRDPAGNARKEATKFSTVYANAFKYAVGEYRAPLRIAAIGVILWYLAIVCAYGAP
jgi:hypothetical protein